jgi:Fic family protein
MAGKQQQREDVQRIIGTLNGHPEGVTFEQILAEVKDQVGESTLHRRLKKMIGQGLIRVTGQTRSTRYHLAPITTLATVTAVSEDPVEYPDQEAQIPLSPEAASIRQLVTLPLGNRMPEAYDQHFLRSYQPNQTFYLSETQRSKLHELGRTAQLTAPAGTYARNILQRLLIDLSWNSSRLEGNNYSLLDTKLLISDGKTADLRTAEESQMILNHKAAIEFIVDNAADIGFNRYTITNLHAQLSDNLLGNSAASGRIRSIPVDIGHSVYVPLAIPQLINELFDVLLLKASDIRDPFEQAFFVMVQLPYLQPFDDVNKRVSRLAANIPLIKLNLAPLCFVDVSKDIYAQGLLGIYELRRIELFKDVFLWAYERSAKRYAALRQSMGEPDTFRLQYRTEIRGLIQQIIINGMSVEDANKTISEYAQALPTAARDRFIEVTETELLNLHDGNFARYQVTPAQFRTWKTKWDTK